MSARNWIGKNLRFSRPQVSGVVILLILTVVALLPATPVFYQMPDTDSSIFLLIGSKIRQGQLPFRDWYDHKPPLIFYLNALGLWLGGGSRWGVWLIELVSLSSASLLGFAFLRRYYGSMIAAAAVAATLLNLTFVHQRGNMTEEYALPFQFGTIFLLGEIDQGKKPRWRLFAVGCMLAMASSLKQPMAGIGVAVVLYLIVRHASQERWRGLLQDFLWVGLGFGMVWSAWFVYFAAVGIFPEFWEAAFAYNFALSGISPAKRFQALLNGLAMLFEWSSFFLAAILGWLVALPTLFVTDTRLPQALKSRLLGLLLVSGGLLLGGFALLRQPALIVPALLAAVFGGLVLSGWPGRSIYRRVNAFQPTWQAGLFMPLFIGVIDFPVAMTFSSLSGNNFAHYFMALLPSLTLLIAFLFYSILRIMKQAAGNPVPYTWLLLFFIPIFGPGIYDTVDRIGPRGDRQIDAVISYVVAHTRPEDYVLQWGIVPQVNLFSGRDAPSRYFFPDPLFVDGYSGLVQTRELLQDLKTRPPLLIIDEGIPRLPLLIPADPENCEAVKSPQMYEQFVKAHQQEVEYDLPQMPEGMDAVYYWICQNYIPVGPVGELEWQVYRLKGK